MTERNGVRRYDSTYLQCRYLRHAWKLTGIVPVDGTLHSHLRCRDCGTERTHVLRPNGDIVANRYVYPVDYKVGGGLPAVKVRREVLRRFAKGRR